MTEYFYHFPNEQELNFMEAITQLLFSRGDFISITPTDYPEENRLQFPEKIESHLHTLLAIQKNFIFPSRYTKPEEWGKMPYTERKFSIKEDQKILIQRIVSYSRFLDLQSRLSNFGRVFTDPFSDFRLRAAFAKGYQHVFGVDLTILNNGMIPCHSTELQILETKYEIPIFRDAFQEPLFLYEDCPTPESGNSSPEVTIDPDSPPPPIQEDTLRDSDGVDADYF